MQRKAPDDGWIPEDVYYAIRAGLPIPHCLMAGSSSTALPGDDGAGLLFVWIIHGELIANKTQIEKRDIESPGARSGVARIPSAVRGDGTLPGGRNWSATFTR